MWATSATTHPAMLNLRRLPALRFLAPYAVGIFLSFNFDVGWFWPALWGLAAAGLLIWSIATKIEFFYTERVAHLSTLVMLVSMGYVFGWAAQDLNHPNHFGRFIQSNEATLLVGHIDGPVEPGERWTRFTFQVQAVTAGSDQPVHAFGKLQVYLDSVPDSAGLEYGQQLALKARINRVKGPSNPDAFDYGKYLHYQNIHYQAFVRKGDWHLTGESFGSPIYALALRSQRHFVEVLRKYLPTSDERAVASALILGYREDIPETLRDAYAQTGAMHVLAVSGLHVGIVFFLLNFLLGRVRRNDRFWQVARAAITLVGLWSFALITGSSPSVVRSSSMFSLLAVGIAINRSGNIYNTLMMSAFLLLIWNPLWLASVGFQLSYLAVFGIVFFQPRLEKLIYISWKPARRLWQLVCVSLAAQLVTTPISLFYFRQFPVYFWLSSLVMVPAAGVILSAGLALLLLDAVVPSVAAILGKVLWVFLKACNAIIYFIQDLPGALIPDLYLTAYQTTLLYIALVLGMFSIGFHWNRAMVYSAFFMVVFSATVAYRGITNFHKTEVVVYDVSRSSLVECYWRQKAVVLRSENLSPKQWKYASLGHRQALGVNEIVSVLTHENLFLDEFPLRKKGPLIQFKNCRMVFLDQNIAPAHLPQVEVDILVVGNVSYRSLQLPCERVQPKTIIFDRTCKRWVVNEWKSTHPEIQAQDVAAEGGFRCNL